MDKPIVNTITNAYRTKAQALADGVSFDNLEDRNALFYADEQPFSVSISSVADYIEFGITTVGGYIDTKLYFDEMLNEGNYLNDLQSYEDNILAYYNSQYSQSETILTDGILNNLSAREMETLTIPLTNAVVYSEHNTQVMAYYNEFRGDRTNAEVYNDLKAYLLPLQQGISRILSESAVQVFTEGTDAYKDLEAWSETFKEELISAIDSQIDLSIKLTDAQNVDTALGTKITDGTTLKDVLISSINSATILNDDLVANITSANNSKTLLDASNSTAQTTLSDLNTAISNGDLTAIQTAISNIELQIVLWFQRVWNNDAGRNRL